MIHSSVVQDNKAYRHQLKTSVSSFYNVRHLRKSEQSFSDGVK